MKTLKILFAALLIPLAGADHATAEKPAFSIEQLIPKPCDFTTSPKTEVETAARHWLDALGADGLQITTGPFRAVYERNEHTPLPNYIRVSDGDWHLTLGFETLVSPDMSAETLQVALQFLANGRIPIPALATPQWRVEALTPSSHAEDGIEILSAGQSRMTVRVTYPRFFAVHGQDLRAEALRAMDFPMPKSCFFHITRDFPGEITFDLDIANW